MKKSIKKIKAIQKVEKLDVKKQKEVKGGFIITDDVII